MSVALGAASYGGRLHLAFPYCHGAWSRQAIERLADAFLEELDALG